MELIRNVIGIKVLIARDQVFALILRHELEKTRPFVLYPNCVVILKIRTEGQHDLGAVQGGKDVGLIFRPQLVFQADPGEKDPITFCCQRVVYVLGQHAVDRPLPVFISLLVTDEDVIGLLLAGNLNDAPADVLDLFCLLPVLTSGDSIRIFAGLVKVAVL